MSLIAKIKPATGRANCLLCKNKILKGQIQIQIIGFRTGGNIHRNAKECITSKDSSSLK